MYEIAENLVIAFERAYTENIQTGSGGPLFGAMIHLHSIYSQPIFHKKFSFVTKYAQLKSLTDFSYLMFLWSRKGKVICIWQKLE